jgi:hypothetical protein
MDVDLNIDVFIRDAFTIANILHHESRRKLTHSQFLEGFKCESQIENSRRVRNRGTLPGSQHFEGVEGHARIPGWD